MVGRCGGGYNTVWEDWSPEGRAAREKIVAEYELGLNAICGHYAKLEESILKSGFRNPLIITCGYPIRKKRTHLPPEMRSLDPKQLLLLEGVTGGSRLWVAQKHHIPVPCLINDFTGRFQNRTEVRNVTQAAKYYADPPDRLFFDRFKGITETYENAKVGYHLGPEWKEDVIIKQRAPLWVSTMNRYGYYVDRLQPNIHEILRQAGVIQSDEIKKKFDGRHS